MDNNDELIQTTRDIIDEIAKQGRSIRDFTDSVGREKANRNTEKELFGKRMRKLGDAAEQLTGSFDSASRYIITSIGGGLLGATIAGIVSKGQDLTRVYNSLANSGSTFEGSLLNMGIAAAQAGMPLSDFAEATMKSSKAVKQMGDKEWPKLVKSFHEQAMANGMYGLSVAQLDDFMATHLETMRKSNTASGATGKGFNRLAVMTAALSDTTGVARDEIASLAANALQGSNALALVKGMPSHLRDQVMQDMNEVTSILASQAGAAGQFLTEGFANTKAMKGFSQFTDQGQALISVGLGNVANQFNNLSENMSVDEAVNTVNSLKTGIENNLDNITNLALAGDAHAKQMLTVYQDLENMSAADIKRKMEQQKTQDGLTKFFLVMETMWDQIMGGFKDGFLNGIKPFMDQLGDVTKWSGVDKFKKFMADLGEWSGILIGKLLLLTPKIMDKISGFFTGVSEGIGDFDWMGLFTTFGNYLAVANAILWPFTTALGIVHDAIKEFPKMSAAILGAVGAFLAWKKIKNIFGDNMVINAATVIVNGLTGGGGGGGDGPDDFGGGGGGDGNGDGGRDRRNNRRGRSKMSRARFAGRNRAGAAARKRGAGKLGTKLAMMGGGLSGMAKVAGSSMKSMATSGMAMKGIGKAMSMTALKTGIKKIPIIGALAGLGLGLQRAMSGDLVGAAMEVGSGVASTIPGIGTAASLAIDGALMAKDSGAFGGAGSAPAAPSQSPSTPADPTKKSRFKRGAMAAGGAALGVAGAAGAAYLASGESEPAKEETVGPDEGEKIIQAINELHTSIKKLVDKQENANGISLQSSSLTQKGLQNVANELKKVSDKLNA